MCCPAAQLKGILALNIPLQLGPQKLSTVNCPVGFFMASAFRVYIVVLFRCWIWNNLSAWPIIYSFIWIKQCHSSIWRYSKQHRYTFCLGTVIYLKYSEWPIYFWQSKSISSSFWASILPSILSLRKMIFLLLIALTVQWIILSPSTVLRGTLKKDSAFYVLSCIRIA